MEESPFVGRDPELAVLASVIKQAAGGAIAVAVVEGEPGVGKTRLVDEAIARADDFGVVRGAANEVDRAQPLAPLAGALGLERLPGLRTDAAPVSVLALGPSPDASFRMVEAAVDAIDVLAGAGPVVVAVDDVQWADPATLSLLHMLSLRPNLPLALIASARKTSGAPARLLDELGGKGLRVELDPLDHGAVAELVAGALGAPPGPRLRAQAERAGGNPFYVTQLLGALEAEGSLQLSDEEAEAAHGDLPAGVGPTVLRRLAWLPDDVVEMLQLAAVLGPVLAFEDLGAVLHRPVSQLLGPLKQARQAGVLGEAGDGLAFRHDLVRDAIYDDLPRSVRAALHADVARALIASAAPADRVAYHLSISAQPGDEEAVDWLRRAAREVVDQSPDAAVEFLERAAELTGADDAPELRAELVTALVQAGHLIEGEELARTALAGATDPATEGVLRSSLAQAILLAGGRTSEALNELEDAARRDVLATPVRARLLAQAALGRVLTGDFAAAARHAAEVERLGRAAGTPGAVAAARSAEAWVAGFSGELGRAAALAEEAVALTRGDPAGAGRHNPEFFLGIVLTDADRFAEADATFLAGRQIAEEQGLAWALVPYQWGLAAVRTLAGEWDDAVAEIQAGRLLCADADTRVALTFAFGLEATIAVHRGQFDEAERALDAAAAELRSGGLPLGLTFCSLARGLLLEARGQDDEALQTLHDAFDFDVALGAVVDLRSIAPDVARLAMRRGDRDRARSVLETLERIELDPAPPTAIGATQRVRGLVEDDTGALLAAVDTYRTGPRLFDLAAALEDAGAALARAGQTVEGTSALDEAVRGYDALGASHDAARTRGRARELGLRLPARGPRQRASAGWESLTPTEIQVVELVTEGLSNPEIGERLFISRRTVSTHLSHVFTKLTVKSRTELAAMALQEAGR